MDAADATARGLTEGDRVDLVNEVGTLRGRVRIVRLPVGTLQVHWPEGNVLIAHDPGHREPGSKVPDYNALVEVVVPNG